MSKILITGGAGYIASHTNIELLEAGYDVVLADNLCNSSMEAVRRVEELSGKNLPFYKVDLKDVDALRKVFDQEPEITAVIHFAALKAVGESVEKPLMYYENNIAGSLNLYKVMDERGVKQLVFSSSATVYGDPESVPVKEDARLQATNPYGQTKLMMEQILIDAAKAKGWDVTILRYFNPVGAHPSGRIGEDPEYPNNLLPFISQVAAGVREKVMIFGNDWPTPDGTGVRDYIHVVDLAKAHVKALDKLKVKKGVSIYNIGTGVGFSVLEMIKAFENVCGHAIPWEFGPRRAGDIASVYGDPAFAEKELNWKAELGLNEMVSSAWKWQSDNPKGYKKE
ncbi:UDP-glucose 4-epimerase GalE [Oceanispirochaeta crateris]|uniref:UDP-glucose 4-epimerase n=1 Tax=Oceanispirochaeta crateris TaxID=2518645 RepID=A0A5C1QM50_9SPIO|nr:UDP-glucose 4-epimerase GalE [Oceanispirochaeta crateris]QEN09143.1 UDP-glucose 4-epimerase GalE [Oceanispirochaeta crateris]